ncbi:MAG: polyphosphate kinase 2 [Thermodesulfobacteriota bacterium]
MGDRKKDAGKKSVNGTELPPGSRDPKAGREIDDDTYDEELKKLETELVKLQDWVQRAGKKIIVLFEGRDAAGKGGMIKRVVEPLNHRVCRVCALGVPTEREKTEWYFQRYVHCLPSAGEIVLFDRSWYNRAGVERVMGFCTDAEYKEFMRACPEFEKAVINSGAILLKYWLEISAEEQEKRFRERIDNPRKQWKISPMDMEARRRWYDYSRARDDMIRYTDTDISPWYIVPADDKKRARLNCITHMLSRIPYKKVPREKFEIPPLQKSKGYEPPRVPRAEVIPEKF